MTSLELPAGVGWTALITAYARAQETRRTDRLFADPYAGEFFDAMAGTAGSAQSRLPRVGPARDDESSPLWNFFSAYFNGRTPFFDEHVRVGAGEARQVCILAAGLDARALRLELPDRTNVFELDTREVLDFKQELLERGSADPTASDRRTVVAVDLREDWSAALVEAGFRPEVPTVWLVEGLLMYLDATQCDRLLDDIAALSAPGSRIAFDYFARNPRMDDVELTDPDDVAAAEFVISLFKSGPAKPPAEWLARHGWTPEITDVASELARHERPLPELFEPDRPEPFTVWLASGTR
ncbi:SAM-dependent methyltransferase [Saccharopolyspora sp. K220]|uniref:SAM-dependent methyltransferase n=1 Tax=Saccharopolyspora soli TaxID=2926618 RepID=UPI001F561F7B|nr:SAM-dependent methyltransferase [Saccharopolyspora soli]MCI2416854.1 SAM-dependent methyltransferase [Saccharopolyspora soli]